MWLYALGLHDDFITKDQDQVDRDTDVASNEIGLIETEDKSSEVLEDSNENAESQSNVRTIGLEGSLVYEVLIAVNSLGRKSLHEKDMSDKDTNPS